MRNRAHRPLAAVIARLASVGGRRSDGGRAADGGSAQANAQSCATAPTVTFHARPPRPDPVPGVRDATRCSIARSATRRPVRTPACWSAGRARRRQQNDQPITPLVCGLPPCRRPHRPGDTRSAPIARPRLTPTRPSSQKPTHRCIGGAAIPQRGGSPLGETPNGIGASQFHRCRAVAAGRYVRG
jgi:hypothetical protein